MEPIKSSSNPLIKYLLKLRQRKFRDREGKFLVEGTRFVEEALAAGWPVEDIIYSPGFPESARGSRLLADASGRGIRSLPVSASLLSSLAFTETPQGVMALCRMARSGLEGITGGGTASLVKENTLVLVVDGVGDPGNLGTIIRSADAFGAGAAILLKGTVDPYNDKTLRSTMGSVFHLPLARNVAAADLKNYIEDQGITLLAGVPRGGQPLYQADLKRPLALLVGGEAAGPSPETLSIPHEKVTIPMPGRAESLNAGVAASVMMYEIVRQRQR